MREYKIRKPQMSEELAEFLGICYGDGNLYIEKKRNDYTLNISCHLIEDSVFLRYHVKSLIKKLFGLDVHFYERKQKNCLSLYIGSKQLLMFLNGFGMPIGRKIKLKVPHDILVNEKYMFSFIRGFVSTDGSLHFKRKHKTKPYYPTIEMTSICPELIRQVHMFLRDQGFTVGNIVIENRNNIQINEKERFRIFIYGKTNLERWMKLIGFGNEKHMKRYRNWKNKSQGWDSNPRPIGLCLSQDSGPQKTVRTATADRSSQLSYPGKPNNICG